MTESTTYLGIDYGLGKTNINRSTGIRYGIIPHHAVLQAWADSSEAEFPDPVCPECYNELRLTEEVIDGEPIYDGEGNEVCEEYYCEVCETGIDDDCDLYSADPIGFHYNEDGYRCHQSADDPDICITKSPYYTYAQHCSPCAPGAVYLLNHLEPIARYGQGNAHDAAGGLSFANFRVGIEDIERQAIVGEESAQELIRIVKIEPFCGKIKGTPTENQ